MKKQINKLLIVKPWVVLLSVVLLKLLSKTIIGPALGVLWLSLFTVWTIGVGESLYNELPDKSILSLKRFKIQIVYVITYLILVSLLTDGGYQINHKNINDYGWKAWIIIPLHLVLMYSMIHTIYFISRCITTLRNKQEGYGWYMLGFWFFPIGIWIIQPQIIELLKKKASIQQGV